MNQEKTNDIVLVIDADTRKRTRSRNNSPLSTGNYAVSKPSIESVND